jgi:hypothetical protein
MLNITGTHLIKVSKNSASMATPAFFGLIKIELPKKDVPKPIIISLVKNPKKILPKPKINKGIQIADGDS